MHDDVASAQTLVEIMRRQRERDRRMLRLANSVAIAAFILAITATFVAWSQHAGWGGVRRSATRSSGVPVQPPVSRTAPPAAPASPPSTEPAPPSMPPAPAPPPTSAPTAPAAPPAVSSAPSAAPEDLRPVAPAHPPSLPGEPATPMLERSPARASRPGREADTTRSAVPPPAPAFGDVDVQVGSRTDAGGELRDYVVTLKDAAGVAFTGADVRLQGRMADRRLVEVVLDPSSRPGQYRAEVRVSPDGPGDLRLRITIRGTTVVVPITPSSGS